MLEPPSGFGCGIQNRDKPKVTAGSQPGIINAIENEDFRVGQMRGEFRAFLRKRHEKRPAAGLPQHL